MLNGVKVFSDAAPPFFKNGFVVSCEDTNEAVIIDPGDEVESLLDSVRENDLKVGAILLTHAHLDHVTGVGRAKAALNLPVWLHRGDLPLYNAAVDQGRMFNIRLDPPPPIDHFYEPGVPFRFGRQIVDILHTPGHCPGGVCLAIGRDGSPPLERQLFVGDTLFAGSIGRTDLPGGHAPTLLRSIHEVLFKFPDDTLVLPGHGPDTTIGRERKTNPFLT